MKFTFQPEARPLDGYTIKRAIHRGGFGEVYYALTDAGKEVALKLLKHHFDVELRGVSQCLNLKHPNLVTIFDVRKDNDGDHWVIMEYVSGKSLAQMLDAHPDGLPLDDVRLWLAGMVDGLSFLHDRGIVHRDLKPANIFLENGVVKIGDVGLSKFISESHRSAQTQSVGTVYYMAPEVAHGRYGREVDVYSLGIMLYELLTGRVPFVGESAGEILMKHLAEKPDLSPIPRRLRPVLAMALEKDPLRRTPTARQVYDDFNRAAAGMDPVPQEIPNESFLHPTMADSSTIERENKSKLPGGFPEPMTPEQARKWGIDPSDWYRIYRAQMDRWSKRYSAEKAGNLKDVIAEDVARAVELAKVAAYKARKLAEENYHGPNSSRESRRMRRRRERWSRYAARYKRKYSTFWGWADACAHRVDRHRAQRAAGGSPVRAPRWEPTAPGADPWSRWWFTPLILGVVVLSLIPRPIAEETLEGITALGFIALMLFLAYRLSTYLFGLPAPAAGTRTAVPQHLRGPAVPPVPEATPPATPSHAQATPPKAAPGARSSVLLGPETPRLIPPRQRISELLVSLTYAAICTALVTAGLSLTVGPYPPNGGQIGQFGGTILVASWLFLLQAKLMEGSSAEPGTRALAACVAGSIVAQASWWLNKFLLVQIPTGDSFVPLFERIGSLALVGPSPDRQPTLAGYLTFFVLLALLTRPRLWRQSDSFRARRLGVLSILSTAAVGIALTAIFAFPTIWGAVWAAAISATVQLSAAWVPPAERGGLTQGAHHA